MTPDKVEAFDADALYPGLTNGSKNSMRTVMRMFQDFQQQTGRSV
jgi:hypothetical protein